MPRYTQWAPQYTHLLSPVPAAERGLQDPVLPTSWRLAQKTHGPQDSIALPERPQRYKNQQESPLGFLGPWLPWSLPYVVWSGLHELVITLRGLRGAHSQASITVSCVVSAFLLLHVRLHTHLLTAFVDAAILCCKHTAWSLGGLWSPGETPLLRPTGCTPPHCQHISHDVLCPRASNCTDFTMFM